MLSPSNSAGSSIEELSPTIRNPVDTGHPLNYPVRHSHLTLESQKEKANQMKRYQESSQRRQPIGVLSKHSVAAAMNPRSKSSLEHTSKVLRKSIRKKKDTLLPIITGINVLQSSI